MVYAVIALIFRLVLAFLLWQRGKRALKPASRTFVNGIWLLSAASMLLGFYVYLFTLILLIQLGWELWSKRGKGLRFNKDVVVFILTLLLFLRGPGNFSLDNLLGFL